MIRRLAILATMFAALLGVGGYAGVPFEVGNFTQQETAESKA